MRRLVGPYEGLQCGHLSWVVLGGYHGAWPEELHAPKVPGTLPPRWSADTRKFLLLCRNPSRPQDESESCNGIWPVSLCRNIRNPSKCRRSVRTSRDRAFAVRTGCAHIVPQTSLRPDR